MSPTTPLDADTARNLADRMITLMHRPEFGTDPGHLNAKTGVASVLTPLRELMLNRDGAALTLAELDTLIATVRAAEHTETERFEDHEQIENWGESILHEYTGSVPDCAVFSGDCHGLYVGPSRELVRKGEWVEAVIADGNVVFRPAHGAPRVPQRH